MQRYVLAVLLVASAVAASAQDLVITNARILDTGTDIARGSIVVVDKR